MRPHRMLRVALWALSALVTSMSQVSATTATAPPAAVKLVLSQSR